jgi:1-acyl-sn-glycerol-3-phosphate acyltransferase
MKPFYWFARTIYTSYFKLFYKHKVYGLEHIPKGAAIIAPNHVSFLDPPIIGASFPEEVHTLAKATLFNHYGLSWMIRNLNGHPVDGTTQDLSSIKMILQLLQEDKKIVIFPEGIRSSDGKLALIKSGIGMIAQRSHAPIIPVYIHGTYEIWPRTQRFPKLLGKSVCVIGSPIYAETFKKLDRKSAQQAISQAVSDSIQNLREWYLNGKMGITP